MKKRISTTVVFLIFTLISVCQQTSKYAGGIVYGPKAAFQIFAPENWILDNQAGMNMGLPCVLYLKSYHWSDSPVIMYAKIASPEFEACQQFIDFAIKEFQNRDTTFTYTRIKSFETKNKFAVIVNDYSQNNHSQLDRVAYIQVKNAVCYIVFSTAKITDFDRYADDVYKVVETFEYKPEYINFGNKK